MKISDVVKVARKEHLKLDNDYKFYEIDGFNQALDLIGNKEIELDVGKIEKIMDKVYQESDKDRPINFLDYAQALKDREPEVIREVER